MSIALAARVQTGRPMTMRGRVDLVLAFAKTLYVNGQATEQTVDAVERLGRALGLRVMILLGWGELRLVAHGGGGSLRAETAAIPAGVEMERVAATMRAIENIASGRLATETAEQTINEIAKLPPAPTSLFALATATGAVGLAVIFGIEHVVPAVLIFISAGAGGILRRAVERVSQNLLLQPFCAALLAGIVGGAAAAA
jgi:uncharacterized membrane protein YjjP (DUF1212 family)